MEPNRGPPKVFDTIEGPEWTHLREIRQLEFSVDLLKRNYRVLQQSFEPLVQLDQAVNLWALGNRWHLAKALQEACFALHNYVSGAKSLVDHSRTVANRHGLKEKVPEYEPRVRATFTNDHLAQFVQQLRELVQHTRLPRLRSGMGLSPGEPGEMTAHVLLSREELLKFSGWNARAKRFLETQDSDVDLWAVITEYQDKVLEFYRWFFSRLEGVYSEDIDRLEEVQQEAVAQHWPELVETAAAYLTACEERGGDGVRSALYPMLSLADLRQLRSHERDMVRWMDSALELIGAHGTVPAEVSEKARRLAAGPHAGKAPGSIEWQRSDTDRGEPE